MLLALLSGLPSHQEITMASVIIPEQSTADLVGKVALITGR